MEREYLVTKSNFFIMNSSYDLSVEEQKLILTLASMVQPDDEEFKPYVFRIGDFIKLLGVKNQAKYTEVPHITKELMKKVFEIKESSRLIQIAWLSSATYEKGTGCVELEFSPKLKPYMLKLKKLFTQYKLANVLSMKSKYSPRIYEILKCNEFKNQGFFEIKIIELRRLLRAEDIYPRYNDFKRKIIEKSQKELKKLSDISFEFEEIKTGRKVTSIRFYIHSKNKITDEIAIGKVKKDPQQDLKKEVQAIFTKHDITEDEASCILKDADNDIELIKQTYSYLLDKNVKNIVGYMRTLVKGFSKPKSNTKADNFSNFKQRDYDFKDLEKKLLGWN